MTEEEKIALAPTVKLARDIAEEFRRKASEVDRMATDLERTGELSVCGEILTVATNFANMRLDLLAVRPIRILERKLDRKEAP